MSEEAAEAAPAQNTRFFTGKTMNFERPKFNPSLENRLEAITAFKKKCGYIFKGSLVNISNERKYNWYKTGSDLKAKKFTIV